MSQKRSAEEKMIREEIEEEKTKQPSCLNLQLTEEQQDVVNLTVSRKNVLVIAKAGTGKSSVALSAAEKFYKQHQLRTLLITYNAKLKEETRTRIDELNLGYAVEAHSYHAVAGKYFVSQHQGAADNSLIHRAMRNGPKSQMNFGLIVIDEAQDMNNLYCRFIKHVLKHVAAPPTMLIVGDPFQRIFGFNGANAEYLSRPQKHFGTLCHTLHFVTRHLTICWRITHEMAGFINSHLNPCNLRLAVPGTWWSQNGQRIEAWWGKGIRANPRRPPAPGSVKVIRGWGAREAVKQTKKMFQQFGNDEVALLAYSLKGERTPIRAIVDKLGKADDENWAVLHGASQGGKVLKGKRLASTIHRMKGLERKGIVLCGMDAFIEKRYPNDPLEHFNIWYVACTRAKEKLLVNIIGVDYATVRCCPLLDQHQSRQPCQVSQLVEYVPFDNILSVPENLFLAKIKYHLGKRSISMDRRVCLVEGRSEGTVEDLTPFLSRAITFRLILRIHKRLFEIPMHAFLLSTENFDPDMIEFVDRFSRTSHDQVQWYDLLKYAVAYETIKSKYKHIWRQLDDFENITPVDLLERCSNNAFDMLWQHAVMTGHVTENTTDPCRREVLLSPLVSFEVPLTIPFGLDWFCETYTGQISGVADLIFNEDTIIGIECNSNVSAERGLELAMYTAMNSLIQLSNSKTVMILCDSAQLVDVSLKLSPLHPKVPLSYELVYRAARRKLQLKPPSKTSLFVDYRTAVTGQT